MHWSEFAWQDYLQLLLRQRSQPGPPTVQALEVDQRLHLSLDQEKGLGLADGIEKTVDVSAGNAVVYTVPKYQRWNLKRVWKGVTVGTTFFIVTTGPYAGNATVYLTDAGASAQFDGLDIDLYEGDVLKLRQANVADVAIDVKVFANKYWCPDKMG